MDAAAFDGPFPTPPLLFDIHNDGRNSRDKPSLPAGPCNFVDLNPGANGARCGCRRFWGRGAAGNVRPDTMESSQTVWCMCSHHACFHDEAQPGQAPTPPQVVVSAGQENERPQTGRDPLSPVHQDAAVLPVSAVFGRSVEEFPGLNLDSASFLTNPIDGVYPPGGISTLTGPGAYLPDTMSWVNCGRSQNDPNTLPPIPPQCLMPSQPPSTASSSQARYLRPFAGKGLNTLSGATGTRGPLHGNDMSQSLLNAATAARDPANDGQVPVDLQSEATCPDDTWGGQTPLPSQGGGNPAPEGGVSQEGFQRLSSTVHGHEQRLDRLENPSFSVAGHEECHDHNEHMDLRVTELESRVEEVEKRLNDDDVTVTSSRHTVADDDATASVVSVATNNMSARAQTLGRSELFNQLQALRTRVDQLQASSFPTYGSPWELEVVFLPFALKGIWLKAHEFSAQLDQSGRSPADEWTQVPNGHNRRTPGPQSPFVAEWTTEGSGLDWLLPRACAPDRMIDRRLRSRGLIKTIQIRGSDARSVENAMNTAFGDLLRIVSSRNRSMTASFTRTGPDPRAIKFMCLQQAWIPLRKIHKDSRLRFLTPGEMLTPALWDVSFLSGVAMKATGNQRLYVTQREAYLQDGHASSFANSNTSAWTWQKVRELGRVYPDSQSSIDAEVPEADAMEESWRWTDPLDQPPTPQRSALSISQAQRQALNRSHTSTMSSSQQYFTGVQSPRLSSSPIAMQAPSPLVTKGRQRSRTPRTRTNSMPPLPPNLVSSSIQGSHRIVSSHSRSGAPGLDRRVSSGSGRPSPGLRVSTGASAAAISKRWRGTRSPSLHPRNTPRWSNRSMSRSPSMGPLAAAGGHDDARGERRVTPFYYATPYSNGPPDYAHARQSSRGPVGASSAYGAAAAEDDDMDYENDRGSSTDADDDHDMLYYTEHDYLHGIGPDSDLDIDVYEDEPDESGELDSSNSSGSSGSAANQHAVTWDGVGLHDRQQSSRQHTAPSAQLPEDEPWPGIEDEMSDDENVDPLSTAATEVVLENGGDAHSDASSQPSEYPSTQRAWHVSEAGGQRGPTVSTATAPAQGQDQDGDKDLYDADDASDGLPFKIHEDEDGGDMIGEAMTH